MSNKLQDRARKACVGHPNAEIQWPHRLLHDLAAALDAADEMATALETAREFIESEYHDPAAVVSGEWLASEARPVHGKICDAVATYRKATGED